MEISQSLSVLISLVFVFPLANIDILMQYFICIKILKKQQIVSSTLYNLILLIATVYMTRTCFSFLSNQQFIAESLNVTV